MSTLQVIGGDCGQVIYLLSEVTVSKLSISVIYNTYIQIINELIMYSFKQYFNYYFTQ